jgi:hypothetical protein
LRYLLTGLRAADTGLRARCGELCTSEQGGKLHASCVLVVDMALGAKEMLNERP